MKLVTLAAVCLLGALGHAQDFFSEWERRMVAGEHAAAARYAEDLATRHPTSSVWAYRAGASLARAGSVGEAMGWLEKAAERGYSGVRTIETDADLGGVRADPRFAAVRARVAANAAARMAEFRAEAARSTPIVIRPPGHDPAEPAPLLVVLHGTGETGRDAANAWRAAARRVGAVLVAPDALRPSGNGYAWTFRDESEWYVEHVIGEAREGFAVGPVILAGFSQGANIAMAMGRSHPSLFDAVVPVCGHWEADVAAMPPAPAPGEDDDRPAWRLLIGERDPWHATNDEAEAALREAGMRVELTKVRGMGHAVPRSRDLIEALEWCLE